MIGLHFLGFIKYFSLHLQDPSVDYDKVSNKFGTWYAVLRCTAPRSELVFS